MPTPPPPSSSPPSKPKPIIKPTPPNPGLIDTGRKDKNGNPIYSPAPTPTPIKNPETGHYETPSSEPPIQYYETKTPEGKPAITYKVGEQAIAEYESRGTSLKEARATGRGVGATATITPERYQEIQGYVAGGGDITKLPKTEVQVGMAVTGRMGFGTSANYPEPFEYAAAQGYKNKNASQIINQMRTATGRTVEQYNQAGRLVSPGEVMVGKLGSFAGGVRQQEFEIQKKEYQKQKAAYDKARIEYDKARIEYEQPMVDAVMAAYNEKIKKAYYTPPKPETTTTKQSNTFLKQTNMMVKNTYAPFSNIIPTAKTAYSKIPNEYLSGVGTATTQAVKTYAMPFKAAYNALGFVGGKLGEAGEEAITQYKLMSKGTPPYESFKIASSKDYPRGAEVGKAFATTAPSFVYPVVGTAILLSGSDIGKVKGEKGAALGLMATGVIFKGFPYVGKPVAAFLKETKYLPKSLREKAVVPITQAVSTGWKYGLPTLFTAQAGASIYKGDLSSEAFGRQMIYLQAGSGLAGAALPYVSKTARAEKVLKELSKQSPPDIAVFQSYGTNLMTAKIRSPLKIEVMDYFVKKTKLPSGDYKVTIGKAGEFQVLKETKTTGNQKQFTRVLTKENAELYDINKPEGATSKITKQSDNSYIYEEFKAKQFRNKEILINVPAETRLGGVQSYYSIRYPTRSMATIQSFETLPKPQEIGITLTIGNHQEFIKALTPKQMVKQFGRDSLGLQVSSAESSVYGEGGTYYGGLFYNTNLNTKFPLETKFFVVGHEVAHKSLNYGLMNEFKLSKPQTKDYKEKQIGYFQRGYSPKQYKAEYYADTYGQTMQMPDYMKRFGVGKKAIASLEESFGTAQAQYDISYAKAKPTPKLIGTIEPSGKQTINQYYKDFRVQTITKPTGEKLTSVYQTKGMNEKLLLEIKGKAEEPMIKFTAPTTQAITTQPFISVPELRAEQKWTAKVQQGVSTTKPSLFKTSYAAEGFGKVNIREDLTAFTVSPERTTYALEPLQYNFDTGSIEPTSTYTELKQTLYKFVYELRKPKTEKLYKDFVPNTAEWSKKFNLEEIYGTGKEPKGEGLPVYIHDKPVISGTSQYTSAEAKYKISFKKVSPINLIGSKITGVIDKVKGMDLFKSNSAKINKISDKEWVNQKLDESWGRIIDKRMKQVISKDIDRFLDKEKPTRYEQPETFKPTKKQTETAKINKEKEMLRQPLEKLQLHATGESGLMPPLIESPESISQNIEYITIQRTPNIKGISGIGDFTMPETKRAFFSVTSTGKISIPTTTPSFKVLPKVIPSTRSIPSVKTIPSTKTAPKLIPLVIPIVTSIPRVIQKPKQIPQTIPKLIPALVQKPQLIPKVIPMLKEVPVLKPTPKPMPKLIPKPFTPPPPTYFNLQFKSPKIKLQMPKSKSKSKSTTQYKPSLIGILFGRKKSRKKLEKIQWSGLEVRPTY